MSDRGTWCYQQLGDGRLKLALEHVKDKSCCERLSLSDNGLNEIPCQVFALTVRLIISSNPNAEVIVDREDYEKIKHHNCWIEDGYVRLSIKKINYNLSRFIMNETDTNVIIDHIHGNKLDNRKSQLRKSDLQKNGRNKTKQSGTSSRYIGVTKNKTATWDTSLKYNGKTLFKKRFKTEETAARMRDLYIIKHYPNEHFKLNFVWTETDIQTWNKKISLPQVTATTL